MIGSWNSLKESPERIQMFLNGVQSLPWDNVNESQSLQCLFDECNKLVKHEIDYYYRSRKRDGRSSWWLRALILSFGGAGFLFPLLQNAGYENVGDLGFLSFGIAGIFVAANKMFGSSNGHIRYITTQLQLEKLMTESNIRWYELKSNTLSATLSQGDKEALFSLLKTYMGSTYKLLLEETAEWGEGVTKAINEYVKQIKGP